MLRLSAFVGWQLGLHSVGYIAVLLGGGLWLSVQPKVEGAVVAYEGFSYTSGASLSGQGTVGGGFASSWSAATNTSIQTGDVPYPGLKTSETNSARINFNTSL